MRHGTFKDVMEVAREVGCSSNLVRVVVELKLRGESDHTIIKSFERAEAIGQANLPEIVDQVRQLLVRLSVEQN